MDIKTDEDDRKIKEKEAALETRRASVIKRCDKKITRRSRAEQREAILSEKLSHVAVDTKQEEIELTHRLAAELSRRKGKIYELYFIRNCSFEKIYPCSFLLMLHNCAS